MGILYNRYTPEKIGVFNVTITVNSNITHTGGALVQTVSGPMTAVTLSPAQGFTIATPTITGNGVTATASGNNYIISGTPTSNVTVSATYETLIPYSDQSKIITYLVPGNFAGSSSTTWGSDYSVPMTRIGGAWTLTNGGKSIRIDSQPTRVSIVPTGNLSAFTVYIVAQYAGTNLNLIVKPSTFGSGSGVILRRGDRDTGSVFTSWKSGAYHYFNSDTLYSAYQAYALSYKAGVSIIDILNNFSPYTWTTYPSSDKAASQFEFGSGTNSGFPFVDDKVYIQLLAIVNDSDSSTVLQNNINNIRTKLNLT